MIVRLRNPDRTIELEGSLTADELVARLDLTPDAVLVIVDGTLVPGSRRVPDSATVEIRNVISGGAR